MLAKWKEVTTDIIKVTCSNDVNDDVNHIAYNIYLIKMISRNKNSANLE
jgi:hypothetical protein